VQLALASGVAIASQIGWAIAGPRLMPYIQPGIEALGGWAAPAFVVLGGVALAACAPSSLLYITGGMVFGFAQGTLLGTSAALLGSTAAFFIARSAFGEHVARALARRARLARFERSLTEHGLWLTILLRLSIVFPIGPVSYAIGLTRIPVRYFLASTPAMLPTIFTYAYAGDLARGLFGAQQRTRAPWEWVLLGLGVAATCGAAWLLARAASRALANHAQPAQAGKAASKPFARSDGSLFPPLRCNGEGEPRMVGVEIEFIALDLASAAGLIAQLFGGRVARRHEYSFSVQDSTLGEFRVELDSNPLKLLAEKRLRQLPIGVLERLKGAVLAALADHVTPNEISTSPLLFEQLSQLDKLVHALGRAGAQGTHASLFNVLAVHFNPSIPSADPLLLRDYIRAYVLLHDSLVEELHVDITRRALGFATAYPAAYGRLVLLPNYAPSLDELIDDYLFYNHSRNHGLDLLPLFAHLDAERVRRAVPDSRVRARPAFHFRLPNSDVSDPTFRVTDEWRLWLEVERLACDPPRLAAWSERGRAQLVNGSSLRGLFGAPIGAAGAEDAACQRP
jgi:uncharacterized membrane protein YdjX (TVP38/TMEM64 family)